MTSGGPPAEGPRSACRAIPKPFSTEENRVPHPPPTHPGDERRRDAALAAPLVIGAVPASAAAGDDWLHVSGNKIVDEAGNEVWLTGDQLVRVQRERARLPRPLVRQHHRR